MRSVFSWHRSVVLLVALIGVALPLGAVARAQAPRKIGELELRLLGLAGTIDPVQPTVPKNTLSGVTVRVAAGGSSVPVGEVLRLLGGAFAIQAELTGPGLLEPVSLRELVDGASADPLILRLPPLTKAGDYSLSQLRLTRNGATVLDLVPNDTTVHVIEQVLVTSVKTRPLTLDEIKAKGIVLDREDYLGFEFTMGLKLESKTVQVSMPVVFDRQGVAIPDQLQVPDIGVSGVNVPTMVPVMLSLKGIDVDVPGPAARVELPDGRQVEVKIPSLLVIPGNVGYMNQVFSAQLFVANGAPVGTGLVVRDVTGTIKLPTGDDRVADTSDDPLKLATTVDGPIPPTLPVTQPGADGTPGTGDGRLDPGEQGQAEFLIIGKSEGYHTIAFDIHAMLDGLATGPTAVAGQATGGVLVRNPSFNISFGVPAIVRTGELFTLYATVTNIGKGIANDLTVTLDRARMSGLIPVDETGEPLPLEAEVRQSVDTIMPGDSRTLGFRFRSQRTGQVVASYLKFEGSAATGDLRFTLGVGERNVPLSPDTFVFPKVVDHLPPSLMDAAVRVLGQAWSIAQAPSGTLPAGVTRIQPATVTQKAQLLAEAGLRVELGETELAAVGDLLFDFYGGTPDTGFDQLLRTTAAGRDLAAAFGAALGPDAPGTVLSSLSEVAISGADFVGIAIAGAPRASADLVITDASGRRTRAGGTASGDADSRATVFVPLAQTDAGNWLGLVATPTASPYTLDLLARDAGLSPAVTFVVPAGDGSFAQQTAPAFSLPTGGRARMVIQPGSSAPATLALDADGDGTFETTQPFFVQSLVSPGPRLLSATVIGPDLLASASPFGFSAALLFDRVVDRTLAAQVSRYALDGNRVLSASRQLSGRLVFASLDQPEGPYVPNVLRLLSPLTDLRGHVGTTGDVSLLSRLADPGAVVSGRVLQAGGEPVAGVPVIYANNLSWRDCTWTPPAGLAQTRTDANGRYEFRYVRRDNCGWAFEVSTQDPVSGAVRKVSDYASIPGERMNLDLVLIGRGNVSGTVRTLSGTPVPDAAVAVASAADSQSGAVTRTDGDGHYAVYGVTVGAVTVKAVKGGALGVTFGQIQRAGTTATVDVALDTGSASVSGMVRKVSDNGAAVPLPGAIVAYEVPQTLGSSTMVPIAYTRTDAAGQFLFEQAPAGHFHLVATAGAYERATMERTTAPGDVVTGADLLITVGSGSVTGLVRLPNGDPAPRAYVSVGERAALTGADGTFSIVGLALQAAGSTTVRAQSEDGLRKGSASVLLDRDHPTASVAIVLSGLGTARFKLLDAAGLPVAAQTVILVAACGDPCGCSAATRVTDADGLVSFTGVPVGTANAVAYRVSNDMVDVARGSAAVIADGTLGDGTLRFAGTGSVEGLVMGPDARPAFGADIEIESNVFAPLTCTMESGVSHRLRTDQLGRFAVSKVNLGRVVVSGSSAFAPTPVSQWQTLTQAGQVLQFSLQLKNTIAGSLTGTVFMPDGTTAAGGGVEVHAKGVLPDTVVRTDAAGHFAFAKVLPEGTYELTVLDTVTGFVARDTVFLKAAQDAQHDVRLKGRGTVRVHVVDASDNAVTEAFVRVKESEYPSRGFEGAADASNLGVVTFSNVSEGPISVTVFDSHGRGGRTSGYVTTSAAGVDVTVRMTITGTVRGHFYLPGGMTPVPFGKVRLVAAGRTIGELTTTGVGDVGSFEFSWVPAGELRLEGQDPMTGRSGVAAGSLSTEGQIVVLNVVAQGIGAVQGLVTSNGAPQPAARVTVTSGSFKATTLADGAGRYLVRGVPEGRIVVQAALDGGLLAGTASGTLSGDDTTLDLDVALRGSGRLVGVVHAFDGAIGPLSTVTAQVGGLGGGTFRTLTDDQGRYAFDRMPAGLTTITVDVVGSVDGGTASAEVRAGEETEADVTLVGLGSLSGQAMDASGNSVVGQITVKGTGQTRYQYTLNTQADGSFVLRDILSGPYTVSLTVLQQAVALHGSMSGTLAAGTTASVEVRLQATATVTGIVLLANGVTPADGARVVLDLGSAYGQLSTVVPSGADGRFSLDGVPLGTFNLGVSDPRTTGVGRALSIHVSTNGETVDAGTIVLDDTPVMVTGVVPADGTFGVLPSQKVVITFSDALTSTSGITLRNPAGASVTGWSLAADGLSVTSTGALPQSTELTLTVPTTVSDVYGRHPIQSFISRFRTADLTPPAVSSVSPTNQQYQVAPTAALTVTFNEALSDTTPLAALVTVTGPGGAAAGTSEWASPTVVVFTPAVPLADNGTYQVTVNGAIDVSGNTQTTAFTSRFSTIDTVAPVLTIVSPAPSSWTNSAKPVIEFSATDALIGVDPARIQLVLDGAVVIPSFSGGLVHYTPSLALSEGRHEVELRVSDRAGNPATVMTDFNVDLTPPTAAQLTTLAAGQTINGVVSLDAAVTDVPSGVTKIEYLRDGAVVVTATPAPFGRTLDSRTIAEGRHTFSARATDAAGNVGPVGPAVDVVVDNQPIVVKITAPFAGTTFRSQVRVTATVSETVDHLDFSLPGVTVRDSASPFEVTLDLAGVPEGSQTLQVAAVGLLGEPASDSIPIVVDRTPPSAPNPALINAEPPANGVSLVYGRAASVEAGAKVEARNGANGATAVATASSTGSFTFSIGGTADDMLSLTATDSVGNRSAVTQLAIRRTPSLPPAEGNTTLHYEGVVVDKVGSGLAMLTPDGTADAVFTVGVDVGDGLTRQLSYIDLVGPATRSTRAGTNTTLGVAVDAGAPLLNNPNGEVSLPVTGGATLTLFASDFGFIVPGQQYTVTVGFTDGSRFIATDTIIAPADRSQVAHSLTMTAGATTLVVPAGGETTTTITLSDIRDIDGARVPDGTRVALTAVNMASKARGDVDIPSSGGSFVDGDVAANNEAFRVYTVVDGSVTATYSSAPVTPGVFFGARPVVQALPADAAGNVLGQYAIGTLDLALRGPSEGAYVLPVPPSLYLDGATRTSHLVIQVPAPDGTKIAVTASNNASQDHLGYAVSSAGGAILGGTPLGSQTHYRVLTVNAGRVECDYVPPGAYSLYRAVAIAKIQVLPVNAQGTALTSNRALGIGSVTLTGASYVSTWLSADTLPLVFPSRTVQLHLFEGRDARSNLLPEESRLLVTAASNATVDANGYAIGSAGGSVVDGDTVAGSGGFKSFPIHFGVADATYSPGTLTTTPDDTLTARLQIVAGTAAGAAVDNRALKSTPVRLLAPSDAVGTSSPSSLPADGALHTATVSFGPVLDAWGNTIPDGSWVVATVANNAALTPAGYAIGSSGGQILDGDTASCGNAGAKRFVVSEGKVSLTYGDQGLSTSRGSHLTARVSLLESNAAGNCASNEALGTVAIDLAGVTSATVSASPTVLHADSADRRAIVTVTDIRDAAGHLVPDGTVIGATAGNNFTTNPAGYAIGSEGGAIVNGTVAKDARFKALPVQNGQVTFEYSASGLNVASGQRTAVVQLVAVTPQLDVISTTSIGTVAISLVAPSAALVASAPTGLHADQGDNRSRITVTGLTDTGGLPIPDGAKVGLTVVHNAATYGGYAQGSAGGLLLSAGTSPGDGDSAANNGNFRIFTVAGGAVEAVYSDSGVWVGTGSTQTVRVSVVPASSTGNVLTNAAIGVGTVSLYGTASATGTGPSTLSRSSNPAQVTFSDIMDSAGHLVPDGTLVAVATAHNATTSNGYAVGSTGGTVTDGTPATGDSRFRLFPVVNGSVTITYSAATAGAGTARIQLVGARRDGTLLSTSTLVGGVWPITITQ